MFIERELYGELIQWKNKTNRKPLLVQGARQVGKTWLIKHFGQKEFPDLAYFNFEQQPELSQFFQITKDPKRIIDNLSVLHGKPIRPGATLIVFDEIQECNEAINSLKYFKENAPEYPILGMGSLLGVALSRGKSFPVGQVEFMTMYPVTFREFFRAADHRLADYLESLDKLEIIPDVFFSMLREKLTQYFITGGMPEAISVYLDTKDIGEVENVLRDILNSYRLDFSKHIKTSDIPKVNYIWQSLPSQLARENKKFLYSAVKKGARARDYENALMWLKQVGLVYQVYRITKPGLPLSAYTDLSAFKIYLFDVGILRQMSGLKPEVIALGDGKFTEFKGALVENFVLQSLKVRLQDEIYYWNSGNEAEVDFVFQYGSDIIPVEVKASENVRSRSLLSYARKYNPRLKLRFSLQNISFRNGLLNLPLFLVDYVERFIEIVL